MTRAVKYGRAQGIRLDDATWNTIDNLAVMRGTSRGEETRLLIGEALAARKQATEVSMLERKVDHILGWVLAQEDKG